VIIHTDTLSLRVERKKSFLFLLYRVDTQHKIWRSRGPAKSNENTIKTKKTNIVINDNETTRVNEW